MIPFASRRGRSFYRIAGVMEAGHEARDHPHEVLITRVFRDVGYNLVTGRLGRRCRWHGSCFLPSSSGEQRREFSVQLAHLGDKEPR
jgi:hypothetical protein